MEIKVLNQDKNSIELQIDSLTVVELLRAYLNKEGADFAAWKRNHPTEDPILRVEGDNAKKLVLKAVEAVQKDLDKFLEEYKKAK